jgi:hypothetical protein
MGGIRNDNNWRTGLIFPIHEKGNKHKCENYIGITLLPQFTKYCQEFLTVVVRYAEMTIEDHQNDFRSGWEQLITLNNKFQKNFCICDEYVINLFVCIYEVRKGT